MGGVVRAGAPRFRGGDPAPPVHACDVRDYTGNHKAYRVQLQVHSQNGSGAGYGAILPTWDSAFCMLKTLQRQQAASLYAGF